MKALELLKEKLAKLCMSFDGVWISEEELDETAKELEKIFDQQITDNIFLNACAPNAPRITDVIP